MYSFRHSSANNKNIYFVTDYSRIKFFMKLYALLNEKTHFTCNNFELLRCSFPNLDRMQICTGTDLKKVYPSMSTETFNAIVW